MNRDFVYNLHDDEPSAWDRVGNTLNKLIWGVICCGLPGVPCYFCTCCERRDLNDVDRERPSVNQSTATADRLMRPHRPHAPGSRKSTPEMISAVRCALSQLQGEPAPPRPPLVDTVPPRPPLVTTAPSPPTLVAMALTHSPHTQPG